MHALHIPIPPRAMTRLRRQAAVVTNFQSCQQTFSWHASTFTVAGAWIATPGNDYYIQIGDGHQILPYTSVQFPITVTAPIDPTTWRPWEAGLYLTPSESTDALAAAFLATQINQFYRAMAGGGFPAFSSMRAVASGATIVFYLAWGMLGNQSFDGDGPLGDGAFVDLLPGVDNPLWFGIIGPRRHAFRVQPRYSGPYYGPPPIG
jgi:hypothetical protein